VVVKNTEVEIGDVAAAIGIIMVAIGIVTEIVIGMEIIGVVMMIFMVLVFGDTQMGIMDTKIQIIVTIIKPQMVIGITHAVATNIISLI
jgi:hypothetical protein